MCINDCECGGLIERQVCECVDDYIRGCREDGVVIEYII